jgi:hypothetical protein
MGRVSSAALLLRPSVAVTHLGVQASESISLWCSLAPQQPRARLLRQQGPTSPPHTHTLLLLLHAAAGSLANVGVGVGGALVAAPAQRRWLPGDGRLASRDAASRDASRARVKCLHPERTLANASRVSLFHWGFIPRSEHTERWDGGGGGGGSGVRRVPKRGAAGALDGPAAGRPQRTVLHLHLPLLHSQLAAALQAGKGHGAHGRDAWKGTGATAGGCGPRRFPATRLSAVSSASSTSTRAETTAATSP